MVPPRTKADIQRVDPIIGMEIHVELATRTKMFTRAPSPAHPDHYEAEPNSLTDPVVLALPGALPVMNRAAVEMSISVGLALGCRIAELSRWDRKSYFYPDLPKAYQISQYDLPLCADGAVDLPPTDERGRFDLEAPARRIGILRAHLEEDAGKLLHEAPGGVAIEGSIVDLNRAGTPLLEIVTQPDFRSAAECVAFARLLRTTCRFLDVTGGVMQMGHMRFEPNINCRITLADGRTATTPIVEIKNLNSFRALGEAIDHELRRQPERWLDDGREMGPGVKTTRGWDADRAVTTLQREKEDAHDYRYFPDPDLPPVRIDQPSIDRIRAALPELPLDRMRRYAAEGLSVEDAANLIEERDTCLLFDATTEGAVAAGADRPAAARAAANLILQTGLKLANERARPVHELGFTAAQATTLVLMRDAGEISAQSLEELLAACAEDPAADPRTLAESRNLIAIRDEGMLDQWCDQAIAEQPDTAAEVRAGNLKAVGRLIGAVMARSGGAADAKSVREKLLEKLAG